MDCCLPYSKLKFPTLPAGALRRPITFGLRIVAKPLIVAAGTSGTSKCQFGGLSAPLEPRTPAGRFLSGVLLDDRDNFQGAARKELERLAVERDEAAARLQLSLGSDEACLHSTATGHFCGLIKKYYPLMHCLHLRLVSLDGCGTVGRLLLQAGGLRIQKHECQDAVEDVMYMLILYKFSDMRVHLVPRLSKCVYNGRLEIWPSKDWELESIHSFEVLQMVREHLNAVIGCRANANVTDSWATTEIQRLQLCKLYAASILYGYFLKSASLRHSLEQVLDLSNFYFGFGARSQIPVSEMFSIGSKYIACGHVSSPRSSSVDRVSCSLGTKQENLRFYLMGFDQEMIQMCAKPKFREAVNLIERHSCALFGDEETGLLETDDVITTSFASLKRFLLGRCFWLVSVGRRKLRECCLYA
ncbi:hypothetical protein DH2020_024394 [Rehmannia glutinosa]|uniref:Uncharacterized protein n=1 Tax=Rehmannia glutinosa TaxID=99300 RepID=A0ABR0W713_REHGL